MVSRLLERGNFDDKEDAINRYDDDHDEHDDDYHDGNDMMINRRCDTFQNECRPVLEKYAGKLLKVRNEKYNILFISFHIVSHNILI